MFSYKNRFLKLLLLFLVALPLQGNEILDYKRYQAIDFLIADYKVNYDVAGQEAWYYAHIKFDLKEKGYPFFDLEEEPERITIALDGTRFEYDVVASSVKLSKNAPNKIVLHKKLKAGTYHLKVWGTLKKKVRFRKRSKTVRSTFRKGRKTFLKGFLPTNLSNDEYEMKVEARVLNTKKEHKLKINCDKEKVALNHWVAKCPGNFNSSSLSYLLRPRFL